MSPPPIWYDGMEVPVAVHDDPREMLHIKRKTTQTVPSPPTFMIRTSVPRFNGRIGIVFPGDDRDTVLPGRNPRVGGRPADSRQASRRTEDVDLVRWVYMFR